MEEFDDHTVLEMKLLSSPPSDNHNGGAHARQKMHKAILVIQSVQMFLAARYEDTEENAVESCVDSDQTVPLLETLDDITVHSRKAIRRLVHVLRSIQAFKASVTSVADACVHPAGSSCTTEEKSEVAESSDGLESLPEHRITIDQTTTNISTIVCQKDFQALEEFGGLRGVETALCTDLVNGISEDEALNRRRQPAFSLTLAPTCTFFRLLWEEVKRKTIVLLLVGAVLSAVFELKEESLKYDFDEGGLVVLIAIIFLVFFASIRKYWQQQRAQKKLHKLQLVEQREVKVHVIRGGETKEIYESELVSGDLVLLKQGYEVPGDGLFVSGEPLELDYGGESFRVKEVNPFLSYGEKVINGDAVMVAISPKQETGWSEMMRKASCDHNTRFKLEDQLDKLNTRMHTIQIIMSILILFVLFFRYMAGKIDDDNPYRPGSMAEPTAMRSFAYTLNKIIQKTTYIKILGVSLVGLTEGVPFVVSIAIVYWNDKTLFGRAIEQDPHCVAKMAHVTRICTDTFITEDVDDLILIALPDQKNKNKEDIKTQIRALRERQIETIFVSSKRLEVLQDVACKCEVVINGDSETLVITGEVFRNYTDDERLEKVGKIRVLGEALPSDKLLLVESLRKTGQVVAYLGQRTDEAPALKRANIGICMGTWASQKTIENCHIIMLDESFSDIFVSMVDSGQCIYHNAQSVLQLFLSTTISSSLISFIEIAAFGDASLTPFQLAWINFAVAFLGGLALLTKPSTDEPLCSVPRSCKQSVINSEMIINILFQVSYLAICTMVIHFKVCAFVGPSKYMKAVLSNIFIFCLFFNPFSSREPKKKNFFRCIRGHKEFWVSVAMFIVLHAVVVTVQDILGYGASLEWKLWVFCVLVGGVSWMVDWLGKCVSRFINIYFNGCCNV